MVQIEISHEITQAANEQTPELSIAEAAQAYAVLKATLEKLALVGVINVDMQEQAMTLTRSVGEEIAVKIRLQRALEVEFQELIEQQHQLRNQNNRIKKEVCACCVHRNVLCTTQAVHAPRVSGLQNHHAHSSWMACAGMLAHVTWVMSHMSCTHASGRCTSRSSMPKSALRASFAARGSLLAGE